MFNPSDHISQKAPLVSQEDPARRKRWDFMTKGIEESIKEAGLNASSSKVDEKRRIVECLLDNTMRTIDNKDGDPVWMDESAIDPRLDDLKEWLNEAGETTVGWTTAGSTTGTGDRVFTTTSLGIVRRVYPKLMATDLMSVQPMSAPTGKVFYLDFIYSKNAKGITADTSKFHDPDSWDATDGYEGQRDYASYTDTDGTNTTHATKELETARDYQMDLSSIDVVAESKKIAATWSVEAQQDYRSQFGLNADSELNNAGASELTREIDRQLINFIYSTALNSGAGTVEWNKSGYTGGVPSELRAYKETITDAIEDAATLVYKKRYKMPTWILTSPDVCARLRKLNDFVIRNQGADALSMEMGGRQIYGTLQSRWVVYCDPWFPVDDIMVLGYKGSDLMDTAMVYAPYIPLYRTPTFQDPQTFKNTRGLMSRFAKTAVVPECLSLVQLTSS